MLTIHKKITAASVRLLFAIFMVAGLAACRSNEDEDAGKTSVPPLIERQGELAKLPEWAKTKAKVKELEQKIISDSTDIQSRLRIATIYISEARITANPDYYPKIFSLLDDVLEIEPNNFESYVYKASVKMSQHRFADALALGEKARSINPNNAYVYGILTDARVELGDYAGAIATSDSMEALKPSLESYSRVSYIREIFGDYPGSLDAMRMAVEAGVPGLESTEWARVAAGDLLVKTGRYDEARIQYENTLLARPGFSNAEMGLARLERSLKNYPEAIRHAENAIRLISESSYVSFLGDVQELSGDAKAKKTHQDVVDLILDAEKNQPSDTSLRHNGNREIAMAYLANHQPEKALPYALRDWNMRPKNIDANDLLGWIYYRTGDVPRAKTCADAALATGSKNPDLLYKASLIYARYGDAAKSRQLLQTAMTVNPKYDPATLNLGL